MKAFITLLCIVASCNLFAQSPAQEAISGHPYNLEERFQIMKTKSSTYEDYKVIRVYILEGVLKITMDSIKANRAKLREASESIAHLEQAVQNGKDSLQQKQASMEGLIYASDHIAVAGINFEKKSFVVLFLVVVVILMAIAAVLTGRLKMIQMSGKERDDFINALTHEFEEYKHKALDKQTKLSRELQTERNKLVELKRG